MSAKSPLWSGEELARVFDAAPLRNNVSGVSIDSRAAEAGDLFVALSGDPGPRFNAGVAVINARDGHEFIDAAIAGGACVVMRHDGKTGQVEAPLGRSHDVEMIHVDDTLDGLWQLGRAARDRMTGRVVAVTGSSGKTTLRAWFECVLSPIGKTHASTGSLNNHWGVPLSLSRMPADSQFGVFEVGTNHPGEIAPLSELVAPDVALLLNVLPAHIGNFPNMAALEQEKLSIAAGLESGGVLVLPHRLQEALGPENFAGKTTLTFGEAHYDDRDDVDAASGVSATAAGKADVTAKVRDHAKGMNLLLDVAGYPVDCEVPFKGPERASSIMALFAVCHSLNLSLESVAENLQYLPLPEGRGNVIEVAGIRIINDSYNANPASMQMSLRTLEQIQGNSGRRIALLGEMLELGELGAAAHKEMARATENIDEVISFGPGFNGVTFPVSHRHFDVVSDFDQASFAASLNAQDVVLVKGSNRVFWVTGFVPSLVAALRGDDR